MSRVAVAGDWHGDTDWARHVIAEAAERGIERILHLGDFGVWPGLAGRAYLDAVDTALADAGSVLWFVDGNHEDHSRLARLRRNPDGYRDLTGRIKHLPRGYRWGWHGRTWLALGGGVSLDRVIRVEGRDWWPQEEITDWQAGIVIADGPADVMLTHDCPVGVRLTFPPPPSWWDPRDLARNDVHRERLQRVVDAVRPSWLFHGHLHRAYTRTVDGMRVVGLNCNPGSTRDKGPNWILLDTATMEWETP